MSTEATPENVAAAVTAADTDTADKAEKTDTTDAVKTDVAEVKKEEPKVEVVVDKKVDDDDDDDDTDNLTSEEMWRNKWKTQRGHSRNWENKYNEIKKQYDSLQGKIQADSLRNKVISEKFAGVEVSPEIKSLLEGYSTEEELNRQADFIIKIAGLKIDKKEEDKPEQKTINPFQANDQEKPKTGHWSDLI